MVMFQVECDTKVLFSDDTHARCVGYIETLIAGAANSAFQFNGERWLEEKHLVNSRVTTGKNDREIKYTPLISTDFLKGGLSNFNEFFEIVWLDSEGKNVTPYIEYSCPSCGKSLDDASVGANKHVVTEEESRRVELRSVGHEMLTCDCGKVFSWYGAKSEEK